ncbi:hypothetical protein [Aeromicrobium camelliae]|uniref:Lhr family ATP-dependent helicase n=1 Tax=Aeromicrobium camelliae TaxID=1538144 RepID=UPI00312CB49C
MSWTRRWSTSRASTTSSRSVRRAGASRRSPTIASSSSPRTVCRPGSRSGAATRSAARTSSAAPSGSSCASSSRRLPPADIGLDDHAVANLSALVADQRAATGHLPTDQTLILERFRDELGDWRVVLLSPYGRAVHAPWALAVGARILERYGVDGSVVAGDDGIVARIPDTDTDPPGADLFVFDPDELEEIVTQEVGGSALFSSRFRECAARALLLPRRNPGSRAPLWQQRQRSAQLLDVARQFPTFPILLETAREVLQDVYDLPALQDLARRIAGREVGLLEVTTDVASPFAQTQLFGYVGAFLYDGDLPLAERRAAALTLDPELLAELLGRTDLRELLDPEVVETTERDLQRLTPERAARSLEHVADLLRLIGPLDADEVVARTAPEHRAEVAGWLSGLRDQRRAIEVPVGGVLRWAAVEDAARLRDALGTALPMGIAAAHLEAAGDPLTDLVARYARCHGPFTTDDVASRYGLGIAVVGATLARLTDQRRVVHGEFHPSAIGRDEWIDAGVLRRLRARSLAAARQQVEPVDALTFARFLPAWQQVGSRQRGLDAVLTAVDQLAGVPLPASAWESLILPSRVADYQPAMLDELLAAGEVSWTGAGTLAGNDGWVLITPGDLGGLHRGEPPIPESTAAALLDAMQGSGAFLFSQLVELVEHSNETDEVVNALWDLVWSGQVSNDTFAPVRARIRGGGAHRTRRTPPRARLHRGARRPARAVLPPVASGRWFALDAPADTTAAQLLRTELALHRHGVVTKGAVAVESPPGGFAAMYRVLREMETSGAALRGYFVDGLGGAQFAAKGAIDRLRAHARDDDAPSRDAPVVLAATDPANPYGAALPWPERETGGHRPGRKAGALVVLHDGHLVLYLERGGKTLLTFSDDPARLDLAAEGFVRTARGLRLGRLTIHTADGQPVADTPIGKALAAAGFEAHLKGLRLDA